MAEEEQYLEYSSFGYENRKKKNRRRRKPNLVLKINNEDTHSEGSTVDAPALDNEHEDEPSSAVSANGCSSHKLDAIQFTSSRKSYFPTENKAELEEDLENIVVFASPEPIENKITFNEKALSRFAATYELEKFKKNALLIFNQEDIDDEPRYGTHADVEALQNTFERFGFEVKQNIYHDLTKNEIFRKLEEFTMQDYTEYGCIGVAVLTHGSHYGRLRARDRQFSEMEIINHLKVHNKPTLVTKPKFLIIQACRGTKIKPGVPVLHHGTIRIDTDTDLEPYHLPEEADMLILHSCYVGSPALRHEVNGSWFIQSLCKTIDQLAPTLDLESIITEVKRVVAIDRFQAERDSLPVQMCQMPVLTSTLIRKLYLRKFGDPSPSEAGRVLPTAEVPTPTPKDQMLDITATPLLPQFGPCSCFLDQFNYMRECLKHFVEDNPNDTTGKSYLDLANTFEDKIDFNTSKQRMIKIIGDHLKINANYCDFFKYIYLSDK